MEEARRLLDLYPEGKMTNHLVASTLNHEGAYDRALSHAETIIRNFPELPVGYSLKGDALDGLGLFAQAIAVYKTALTRSHASNRPPIHKKIGLVYLKQQHPVRAYRALKKGIDVFSADATHEDLYHFGLAAFQAGKTREAHAIFYYLAEFKVAAEDTGWRNKVEAALAWFDDEARIEKGFGRSAAP
jgi:tetratricopeptide (TPR) repeat protein